MLKLLDGKCWMTQNLRIVGSRTLTSEDSDVTDNFSLPLSGWQNVTNDCRDVSNIYSDSLANINGNFYSWFTATAGEGTYGFMLSGGEEGKDTTQSICPKNWKMPMKSDAEYFNRFYDSNTIQLQPANFKNSYGYIPNSAGTWYNGGGATHSMWTGTGGYRYSSNSCDDYRVVFFPLDATSTPVIGPWPNHGLVMRCLAR